MISKYYQYTPKNAAHIRPSLNILIPSDNQNQRAFLDHPQQPFDGDYKVPSIKSVDEVPQEHSPFSGPQISKQHQLLIVGSNQNENSQSSGTIKNIPETQKNCSQLLLKLDHKFEKFRNLFDLQKVNQRKIWILACSDSFLKIWLTITYLLFISINIYMPFQIAYQMIEINSVFVTLKLIDILVFLRTEIYQNGLVVQEFYKILQYYVKTFLFRDLIYICVQFILQISNSFSLNWVAVVLAIYASQSKSQYNFNWIKMQFAFTEQMSQLLHQTGILIVWINFLICFWLDQTSSIEDEIFTEKSYLSSLYHVVTIISFNSQFKPTTEQDAFIFCGMSFISLFIVGFLGKIQWEAYCNDYSHDEESQNYLNQLSSTLSTKHLVKSYQSCKEKINCENLMKSLPKNINTEISRQILKSYFKKYESLDKIAEITEIKQYEPKTMIITQSQQDDCSLYFLLQGRCKILTKTNAEILGILENTGNEVKSFGELSFYTKQERTASIYCEGVCLVLKIERKQFVQQLNLNDREYFNLIREQILFQNQLPITCLCCQMPDHVIQKCPQLSYQPKRQAVIDAFKQTSHNHRQQYVRSRNKRSINGLIFARFAEINVGKFLKLFQLQQMVSLKSSSILPLPYDEESFNKLPTPQDSFQPILESDEGNVSSFKQMDQEWEQWGQKSQKSPRQQISNHNITAGFVHPQFQNVIYEQSESDQYDESDDSFKVYQKSARVITNLNSYKSKGSDSLALSPIIMNHKQTLRRKSNKSSQSRSKTKTETKLSLGLSSFQAFGQQSNANFYYQSEIIDDFDRMNNCSIFLPYNNPEIVIQQANLFNSQKQLTNKDFPGLIKVPQYIGSVNE